MIAVWVVRDEDGMVRHVTLNHGDAMDHAEDDGDTIARETLLTPAHAAVIEAAKAFAARPSLVTEQVLIGFVATLRAQEGA